MIRESDHSDLKSIIDLKIQMFEDANLIHLLHENAKELIEKAYLELQNHNNMKHFVIDIDDEIIGMAGAFIKNDIPYCFYKTPFYGFIGDVYIKREFRRKGYATLLTEKVIEWLKCHDVKMIKLLATPEAEEIYKQFGFKDTIEMILKVENF
ncbi:GNAT family N-acetyltransferase [Paenibacillus illinoisensis]|uniref:GNAT family N-acetyltransferase n=1 Tax=Paenibacillus illinoisensis TaxID=59845 RepID=UPI00301C50AB